MFKNFKSLLGQRGNALLNVVVAASVVGAGALMLSRTGGLRGEVALDMKQNSVIENTILDMKVFLANKDNCKATLDNNYTQIGQYQAGSELELGISIDEIREVEKNAHDDPSDRVKKILVVFNKERAKKSASGGKVSSKRVDFVFVQTFIDENNNTVCSSVETLGVDDAFKAFCDILGGTFTNQGRCDTSNLDPTSPYVQELFKISCESIGGNYNGAFCDQINLPTSPLTSMHLKENELIVNGLRRTNFANADCTSAPNDLSYVADGVNEDGTLRCKQLACPTPYPSTSTYRINTSFAGEVFCSCDRDRPIYDITIRDSGNNMRTAGLRCGATDTNYCQDYTVDDGCNLAGNTTNCTIKAGKRPNCACAQNTLIGDFCTDPNCGTQCPGTMQPAGCGSSDGVASANAPSSNLCANSTNSPVVPTATCPEIGDWKWTCTNPIGDSQACSAPMTCEPVTPDKPDCGDLNGMACDPALTSGDPDLCQAGHTVQDFMEPTAGQFTWICNNGGELSNLCACGVNMAGKCGPKDGTACAGTETADTPGLCDPATPTVGEFETPFPPFDLGNRYQWQCRGLGTGADATCMCTYDDGVCGSADTQSADSLNALKASYTLCDAGTPTPDPTGDAASWSWVCKGETSDSPTCKATCGSGVAVDGECGSGDGTTDAACAAGQIDNLNTSANPNTWICRGSCGGNNSPQCEETACPETTYEWKDSAKACIKTTYSGDGCAPTTEEMTAPGAGICNAKPNSGTCQGTTPPLLWDSHANDGLECRRADASAAQAGDAITQIGQCWNGSCSPYKPCNDEVIPCSLLNCSEFDLEPAGIKQQGMIAPTSKGSFLKLMIVGDKSREFVCDEDLCGQKPTYMYKAGARTCVETAFKKVNGKCEKVLTDFIHKPCEELKSGTCTGNIRHEFTDADNSCDPGDCGPLPRTIKWRGDDGLECINNEPRDTPIKVGEISTLFANGCNAGNCGQSSIQFTCEMPGEPPFKTGVAACSALATPPTNVCDRYINKPCSIFYNGKWYLGKIDKDGSTACNNPGFVCQDSACDDGCNCLVEPGAVGALQETKVCI